MRAIAVVLVALDHAGIGALAGGYIGVDVFFVLSGFLITGLLLSGAERWGRVEFRDFYARRARRILPAAGLTLIATSVASYLLLNFVRVKEYMVDVAAAALFISNFRFADVGTDYFARTAPPSPVQQFWTLGIEEQFYVVWPLLLAVLLGVAFRRRGGGQGRPLNRRRLAVGLLAVTVVSFAWSVHETGGGDRATAYFSTLGRVWELGLGAGLALAAARVQRLAPGVRTAAGWAGLAMILAAAFAFSHQTRFPGVAALLPTLGAALVISAGIGDGSRRAGVGRVLAIRPLRYVGDRSYAFYLWHWPVLVIWAEHEGHAMSVPANLTLLAVAFALSIVSYRYVENPIRLGWLGLPSRARADGLSVRRLGTGGALLLWPVITGAVLLTAGALALALERRDADAEAATPSALAGAGAPGPLPAVARAVEAAGAGEPIPEGLSPSVGDLLEDRFYFESGCAPEPDEVEAEICPLGDERSQRTLVVLGDSKAQMWMSAVVAIAERDGWRVLPLARSSCTPSGWAGWAAEEVGPECREWYEWATERVAEIGPTVTLIAGNYGEHTADVDYIEASAEGLRMAIADASAHSERVIVVGDVPGHDSEPVDCLLRSDADLGDCSTTMTDLQVEANDAVADVARQEGAGFVDTTAWACAELVCPMVVGTTIAYADRGHLSETYVKQLVPVFAESLDAAGLP